MSLDIIYNKAAIIQRCMARINEEYENDPNNLLNYTKQDSIILNIQRACEAAIDLAMHFISKNKLGLPQSSRDCFRILHNNRIMDHELMASLQSMVGFRNIAVHAYQELNLDIVKNIVEHNLDNLLMFSKVILTAAERKLDNT